MLVCAALVANDQLIKLFAINGLSLRIPVIPGLFYLTYVENRGAAFGIFQGHTVALAIISITLMAVLLAAVLTNKIKENALIWSAALILAGGIGNCIDRLYRGFVVDYLDFRAILGFPVFNFADCCVVTGTFIAVIYIILLDRKKTSAPRAPGD